MYIRAIAKRQKDAFAMPSRCLQKRVLWRQFEILEILVAGRLQFLRRASKSHFKDVYRRGVDARCCIATFARRATSIVTACFPALVAPNYKGSPRLSLLLKCKIYIGRLDT